MAFLQILFHNNYCFYFQNIWIQCRFDGLCLLSNRSLSEILKGFRQKLLIMIVQGYVQRIIMQILIFHRYLIRCGLWANAFSYIYPTSSISMCVPLEEKTFQAYEWNHHPLQKSIESLYFVKMASFHIKSQQEGKTFNERICLCLLFLKEIFDTLKTLQRVV